MNGIFLDRNCATPATLWRQWARHLPATKQLTPAIERKDSKVGKEALPLPGRMGKGEIHHMKM